MLTVDTEIGGASSNSYITVAEANTYHEKHTQTSTWDNASTLMKESAVVMATRVLDERVDWKGAKKTQAQALFFPAYCLVDRYGYSILSTIIPTYVKDGTAELSRYLIDIDITSENNLDFVKMSNVEFRFNKVQHNESLLPSSVMQIVKFYIKNEIGSIRLARC